MGGLLFEEPGGFDREGLAARLRSAASENIYIGGSSWKYEGWLGQVYTRDRYLSRGRFSKRLFETECLREYAETFSHGVRRFRVLSVPHGRFLAQIVPPGAAKLPLRLQSAGTDHLQGVSGACALRAQAGKPNEAFLDARALEQMFLRPLLPHREKTALLIFEFGAFGRRSFADPIEFLDRLDPFLASLPPEFRYAIEIRNPEFLARDYFACCAPTAWRTCTTRGRGCRNCGTRWRFRIPRRRIFWCAAPCCAAAGRTRTRWRRSPPTPR